MTENTYLQEILKAQKLEWDSPEVTEMERVRDQVEALLERTYQDSNPKIEFGGSMAKGTMIRERYDIDIVCYFPRIDDEPGDSLAEIFKSVKKTLETEFEVRARTTALRLSSDGQLTHIDVVPGRFCDESEDDTYLHFNGKGKNWLKTNLRKHVDHIKESGVVDSIRLAKLWNLSFAVDLKTFVLELLLIKAAAGSTDAGSGYAEILRKFWQYLLDNKDNLSVEDPANPYGNDLSEYLDGQKQALFAAAERSLKLAASGKWTSIFGELKQESSSPIISVISQAVISKSSGTKPWAASDD